MQKLSATAAVMMSLWAQTAGAETILLDIEPGKQFQMQIPHGLCAIDPADSVREKETVEVSARLFQGSSKILARFRDCEDSAIPFAHGKAPTATVIVAVPLDEQGKVRSLHGFSRRRRKPPSKARSWRSSPAPRRHRKGERKPCP
jgi:hypothetical protein